MARHDYTPWLLAVTVASIATTVAVLLYAPSHDNSLTSIKASTAVAATTTTDTAASSAASVTALDALVTGQASDTAAVLTSLTSLLAKATIMGARSDFGLELSRGNLPGLSHTTRVGANDDVDSPGEDLWHAGGSMTWIATAGVLTASSTSASDTAAGVGARTVIIIGLDSAGLEINETVTMAGLANAVPTTLAFWRVNNVRVVTTGTSRANVGAININHADGLVGHIGPDHGLSLSSQYTVPANKTAYLTRIFIDTQDNSDGTIHVYCRLPGTDTSQLTVGSFITRRTAAQNMYTGYLAFPPRTDTWAHGALSGTNALMSVTVDYIFVES
jgi:hypothetical protein